MALQPWMGLSPERRDWAHPHHRCGLASVECFLTLTTYRSLTKDLSGFRWSSYNCSFGGSDPDGFNGVDLGGVDLEEIGVCASPCAGHPESVCLVFLGGRIAGEQFDHVMYVADVSGFAIVDHVGA